MATPAQHAIATPATPGGVRHVTSKDGTRIAYEVEGSGPPLVVVWGALGHRRLKFAKQMRSELARHFMVYEYDRRGRGDSGDTKPFALQKEIDDLAAMCKAAGGNPHVFATSSGAALALEAAAAGVPMDSLLAWEPPYVAGQPDSKMPSDYRSHMERLVAEGRNDDAVKYFMTSVGVPGFFVGLMRMSPIWKDLRSVAHTLPYDAAAMGDFHPPLQRLARIRVRTMVGSGAKSPPSLRNAADQVAAAIPNSQKRTLPKQNHGVKPKAIAPLLVEFCGGRA